jgi:hypothetical protein
MEELTVTICCVVVAGNEAGGCGKMAYKGRGNRLSRQSTDWGPVVVSNDLPRTETIREAKGWTDVVMDECVECVMVMLTESDYVMDYEVM